MSPKNSFVRRCLASFTAAFAITFCALTAVSAAPAKWPTIPQPPAPPRIPTPPKPIEPPSRPLSPIEMEHAERMKQLAEVLKETPQEQQKSAQEELAEFLKKLLDEFGPDARYGITSRFIFVYDTTDAYAEWCATLMERVASTYETFVSRVRLVEDGLADPMVVFIFAKKENYEAYLRKIAGSEFENETQRPVGFYDHASNRSVFFDLTGQEQNIVDRTARRTLEEVANDVLKTPDGDQNLSTIIHEATHQVAFNYGLFSRQGENPSWAVEGLSTLFEAPSGEPKDGGWKVLDEKARMIRFPINKRRLMEFQQFASTTNEGQPVKKCVGLEKIRGDEPCAYPTSWALFYYLYRYNPKVLARYLTDSAAVQPRLSYSSRERVYEFAYYFGDDWDGMWLELRAFADALELELKGVDPAEAEKQTRAKYNLPEVSVVFGRKGAKKNAAERKSETEKKSDGGAKQSVAGVDGQKEPAEKSASTDAADKTKPASKSAVPSAGGKSSEKKSADLDDWLKEWSKDKKQ